MPAGAGEDEAYRLAICMGGSFPLTTSRRFRFTSWPALAQDVGDQVRHDTIRRAGCVLSPSRSPCPADSHACHRSTAAAPPAPLKERRRTELECVGISP